MHKVSKGVLFSFSIILAAGCAHGPQKTADSSDNMKEIAILSEKAFEDTASTFVEISRGYQPAWDLSQNVIRRIGVITFEDAKEGKFRANIRNSRVELKLTKLTDTSTRVEIKAVQDNKPDMELTKEITEGIKS